MKNRQYRIKTVTNYKGNKLFYSQLKCWLGWFNLKRYYSFSSEEMYIVVCLPGDKEPVSSREDAVRIIEQQKEQFKPKPKKKNTISYELIY